MLLEFGFRQLSKNATPFYGYALATTIRFAVLALPPALYLRYNRSQLFWDGLHWFEFAPFREANHLSPSAQSGGSEENEKNEKSDENGSAAAAAQPVTVPPYVLDPALERRRRIFLALSAALCVGYECAMHYYEVTFPVLGVVVPALVRALPSEVVVGWCALQLYEASKQWPAGVFDHGNQNALQLLAQDVKVRCSPFS